MPYNTRSISDKKMQIIYEYIQYCQNDTTLDLSLIIKLNNKICYRHTELGNEMQTLNINYKCVVNIQAFNILNTISQRQFSLTKLQICGFDKVLPIIT